MVDAREYHDRTNHDPESVREQYTPPDPAIKPRPYKRYRDLSVEPLEGVRPPVQPTLSVIGEPVADPLAGTEQSSAGDLDRRTLATLLYEANGVVNRVTRNGEEVLFRAASCTGKLYHVDCYAVCGDLEGLPAGVYHFDPRRFSLDVLRTGDYRGVLAEAVGESAASDGGSQAAENETGIADAPVTVVATSTWWRNAWKYRERTYRHAFWDAGTVLANLLGAAHALDTRAEVVAGFADGAVSRLVGVDPTEEAPVALVPLGRDEPTPEPRAVDPIDPETEPLSADPVDYPLIHEAWRQSTLESGDDAAAWRARCLDVGEIDALAPGAGGSESGERVALEPVDHETATARPLHHTIVRRGSRREFSDRGPTRRQVGTVLDRALRGVPGDWNGGEATGLAYNDVVVLSTDVEGVPDGTYRYDHEEATLERTGDANSELQTELALEQSWAGDAHVNVYLLADIGTVVDRLGNRGYRLAQLEAGVALGRLYLATFAHRALGGTGLTFYDGLVADHCAPESGAMPTCLFAFGRSA
ncbi:SagB family peptide dehydrogenase [Natrononativus amylolyticus]|uniref:SagB family peptide dehydrogenase n=1 Tax=Natrononativus amylolyticus TaxID=2963434 RepID=UPI0020CC5BC8|nr:SagB family peptide dehydrogenase [Natrononativus amylolyticus]